MVHFAPDVSQAMDQRCSHMHGHAQNAQILDLVCLCFSCLHVFQQQSSSLSLCFVRSTLPLHHSTFFYLCFTAGIGPIEAIPSVNFRLPRSCSYSWFCNFVIFGIWNLDLFCIIMPPICISENLTELQALCLDYVVAICPLILTVLLYNCIQQHARGCRILVCLWRPYDKCFSLLTRQFNWNPAESLVQVFASFLLLCMPLIFTTEAHIYTEVMVACSMIHPSRSSVNTTCRMLFLLFACSVSLLS